MIERAMVEAGIWPLVEAANKSGYETYSSCEGHVDDRPAAIGFFASSEGALQVHEELVKIREELLCSWELTARFIWRGRWILGWRLENYGVKDESCQGKPEFWQKNTEAGQADVPRLARMFTSLGGT